MTALELVSLWVKRDTLYRVRKENGLRSPLTQREIDAITWWRNNEAEELTADETVRAKTYMAQWEAPSVSAR